MDLHQRRRALTRRGFDALSPRVLHSRHADRHVRYDSSVSAGEFDRAEWAKVVNELLDEIPRRNKTELFRRIGFTDRTIDRWLNQQVDVAESSIRQVAERTGRKPMEMLIRVGYYKRDEMPAPAVPPEDQWIVDRINASPLGEAIKQQLITIELDRAKREREERQRQIDEQIALIGPKDGDR